MNNQTPHTPRVKQILAHAASVATASGHNFVGPVHVFMALLVEGGEPIDELLKVIGSNTARALVATADKWKPICERKRPVDFPGIASLAGAISAAVKHAPNVPASEVDIEGLSVVAINRSISLEHTEFRVLCGGSICRFQVESSTIIHNAYVERFKKKLAAQRGFLP